MQYNVHKIEVFPNAGNKNHGFLEEKYENIASQSN
jgi:hypothetical protein